MTRARSRAFRCRVGLHRIRWPVYARAYRPAAFCRDCRAFVPGPAWPGDAPHVGPRDHVDHHTINPMTGDRYR